jgi:hypothetical protein
VAQLGHLALDGREPLARGPGHLDQPAQGAFELAGFHEGTLRGTFWAVNRWQPSRKSGYFLATTSMSDASETPRSATIAVGCAELPPGMNRAAYFRRLPFLEMRLPGDQVPARRVAERWRAEAGDGQLALVAPRALSAFHQAGGPSDADLDAAVAELAEAARAAGAVAVVFATPPGLSPSSAHRDRLRTFFTDVASAARFGGDGGIARIWQADGLWRPPVAAAFAEELGIVASVDPLAGDPLEEGIPDAPHALAYARVTGLGRPSRPLGVDDLERLADWASTSQRAFISLATPTRLKDALSLARQLA